MSTLGTNWHQHVRNDEVRRLTKQPHLSAIVQSRRLSLFGHIARIQNRCKTDLNSFPRRILEETTGTSSHYLEKTIQQDLKFSDLNMDDAVDLAQNRPL